MSTSTSTPTPDPAAGVPLARWTFRPGPWTAALGRVSVVGGEELTPRIAAAWAVNAAGGSTAAVVGALLPGGLADLDAIPDLVVLAREPDRVVVLVRGALRVHARGGVGGDRVCEGAGTLTWVEHTLIDPEVLEVELPAVADGPQPPEYPEFPEYAVPAGLVRASTLRWELAPATSATPPVAGPVHPDPVAAVEVPRDVPAEPDLDPLSAPLGDLGVTAADPAPVLGDPVAAEALPEEPTMPPSAPVAPVVPPLPPLPPDLPVPPAPPVPAPPRADEAVAEPPAGPGGWPVDDLPTEAIPLAAPVSPDHDGLTQIGASPAPAAPDPLAGPGPVPGTVVARIQVNDGEPIDVDRAVLIGRAPEARQLGDGVLPRLLPVPSPMQEISSTHLEIRPGTGPDHGSAVATDLGSTNGTVVVLPGLAPEELRPGIAWQLVPGAVINLGDGVMIHVLRP